MAGKLLAWRLVALAGVALSALSLAESWRDDPLFCPLDGGCGAVTRSAWGRPLGIPLPYFGVAGFGLAAVLSLYPGAARGLGVVCLLGGAAGLGLAAVQASVLRQYCRLCLLIDGAAMLLALIELGWPATGETPAPRRWPWLAALGVAAAGPLLLSRFAFAEPGVPAEVLAIQAETPGRLTAVFVTDFQCEQCRLTHPVLRRLAEEHSPPVRLVLLVFPLPAHEHSRDAARAYFAAEGMGKGPEMAEALLAADDLTPAGCEKLAARLGLDVIRYREAAASEAARARLDETAWMRGAGVPGLPAIWIGSRRLTGSQTEESLRSAIEGRPPAGGGG